MDKLIIAPKIHIYKNVFKNIDNALSVVKESELQDGTSNIIPKWGEWAAYWKGAAAKANNKSYQINNVDSDLVKSQKELINEIKEIFFKTFIDYINCYKKDPGWQDFILQWENFSDHPWEQDPSIDFLKYNKEQSVEMQNHPIAMNYHTDNDRFDAEWRGTKKIVTITFYLNDDYEGGEISIYDPIAKQVYSYKPKAGDVTVFPSGMDYYHGVLTFKGNDRYLVRMFMSYEYEGSEKWKSDLNKYGIDYLVKIEREIRKKVWENGGNLINMVFPGKEPFNNRFNSIYLDSDPIYIDGSK
jgi:hypothetical protein